MTTTIRLVIAAVVLAVVLLLVGPAACNALRDQKVQNRVTTGQLGAAQESGAEAVNTVGNVAANEAASADLTRTNEQEIRNAKGADDLVDAGVRDAGLRAICRRKSAASDPKCRVFQTHSR